MAELGHASSMRQDGALAFGTQQGVNAIDPADPAFRFDVDRRRHSTSAATARSSTTGSRPSTA